MDKPNFVGIDLFGLIRLKLLQSKKLDLLEHNVGIDLFGLIRLKLEFCNLIHLSSDECVGIDLFGLIRLKLNYESVLRIVSKMSG